MTVVYVDSVFVLNALMDYLLVLSVGRLAGIPLRRGRYLPVSYTHLHHEADQTRLQAGDCIVIDMGCRKNRYCSDMTRTFFCKTADPKYAAIHDLVREANH